MPHLENTGRRRQVQGRHDDGGHLTVRLRDCGLVTLRPLMAAESEPLLSVFAGLSDRSRTMRYLTGMPRLPGVLQRMLTDVDGDHHVAWLASVDGEPAGIARYVRVPECRTTAEIAFEVVDRHHDRGLATVLLDAVTTVAAAKGVRRIRATALPGNQASRRLLARVGATPRLADGLVEAEGPLRLLDHPVVDRAAVVDLACGVSLPDRGEMQTAPAV